MQARFDASVAAVAAAVESEAAGLETSIDGNTALINKVLSGDYAFSVSPATVSPTVAECTAAAQVYTVAISLVDGEGEVYTGYNGPVLLAIADNDDNFNASIDPAAGERTMINGVLEVEVTLAQGAWTAGKTATLTVSDPATAGAGITGWGVANATFVATVQE